MMIFLFDTFSSDILFQKYLYILSYMFILLFIEERARYSLHIRFLIKENNVLKIIIKCLLFVKS
uniref:Uncharacterized protein n=1 Tax=Bartonella rochalimae ATCC BAA-1498 TaxID=685782 RepID=E6YLH3_9HYPH|nr:hypothetical protein BARRO_50074 [Bartonella rochalimae ATCC BAA-1498]